MKKFTFSCLAIFAVFSTLSFSQAKYTSSGYFGIGTTSPETLLHLKASDPVLLMESSGEHDNTIRLCEGTTWLGAFLRYDGGINKLILGTHISSSTSTSDDRSVLTLNRSTGQIELNPISTSYNFQSFVTKAPNYETQCYNVKLGSSNNFWVDGDGDVWHKGLHTISDASLKENIEDLSKSIDLLDQLRPVKYNFKSGAFGIDRTEQKIEYGLLAQEVETVIPDIVGLRDDGLKSINYIALIPILIDAIQSQQDQIDSLINLVNNTTNLTKSASVQTAVDPLNDQVPILSQNIPNPFNEVTSIKYYIPQIESSAMINIYDLQGSQVMSYNIAISGDGEIMIPASALKSGLYIYNLIVDGMEIGSRRMVLTD